MSIYKKRHKSYIWSLSISIQYNCLFPPSHSAHVIAFYSSAPCLCSLLAPSLSRTGWFGTVVEYGAERKISRHSVLSATVSVGVPQGVTLKIKYSPTQSITSLHCWSLSDLWLSNSRLCWCLHAGWRVPVKPTCFRSTWRISCCPVPSSTPPWDPCWFTWPSTDWLSSRIHMHRKNSQYSSSVSIPLCPSR